MLDMHQAVEAVATYHDVRTYVLKHQPKLVAARARTQTAQLTHHADNLRLVQLTFLK